jgi:hypothetical protein
VKAKPYFEDIEFHHEDIDGDILHVDERDNNTLCLNVQPYLEGDPPSVWLDREHALRLGKFLTAWASKQPKLENNFIIAVGDIVNGFETIGPFDDIQETMAWASRNVEDVPWHCVAVTNPDDYLLGLGMDAYDKEKN